MVPLAATAGTPIPGKLESPVWYRFLTGVKGRGKASLPALNAGPIFVNVIIYHDDAIMLNVSSL